MVSVGNLNVDTENGYWTHSLYSRFIAYIIFQNVNADIDVVCEWALMVWKFKISDVGKRHEIICAYRLGTSLETY